MESDFKNHYFFKEATAAFLLALFIIVIGFGGWYAHIAIIDYRVNKAKESLLECLENSILPSECK